MTFKRVVAAVQVVAVIAALAFVVLLFANEKDAPAPATAAASGPGATIFSTRCASCHGAAGEGGIGPRLAGTVTDTFPDEADQIAVVANGRAGMPAFRDRLTTEEITAVVRFTRNGL